MSNEFANNLTDAVYEKSVAYPAANATVLTASMDLGHVPPQISPENVEVEMEIPALANNSDNTKTILHDLHDSADDSTFAEVDPLIESKLVGVTTTGSAAKKVRFRLPSGVRRYIKVKITVPTGAGDNTASTFKVRLKF